MDNTKYQYEGMKWLMELELLNQPQAINTIKLNIMMASSRIKEVELLIYRENKSMLVLLDLTWMGRKFFKKRIYGEVEDVLSQLLPTFRFRVTDDTEIMKLAIAKVKQALSGGKYENSSNSGGDVVLNETQSPVDPEGPSAPSETLPGGEESPVANQEEQPKAAEAVFRDVGSNDPSTK